MKCIIPGNHVKVFGRAIHSLSKIGDELYIESLKTGMALRTVNSSRSAYACFIFNPSFFHQYDDGGSGSSNAQNEETLKCKVTMKSCLSVFRSLSSIEKTVERCELTLNVEDARLVFQLYCRHGIVKTHNLAFIECETLQAVFSPESTSNHLTAQSRLLCDVVANFQNNQEEITLVVVSDRIVFKNYCDDVADQNKMMHTELNLDHDEFDVYTVNTDADITFCLKELRAILSFSEATTLPLSLHFDTSGKPVIFSMEGDGLFEACFVLATLADPANESSSQVQHGTSKTVHNKTSTYTSKDRNANKSVKNDNRHDNTTIDIRTNITVMDARRTVPISSHQECVHPSDSRGQEVRADPLTAHGDSSGSSCSPVIPPVMADLQKVSRVENITLNGRDKDDNDDDDDDEMNDTIPGTPPNKKFKALFGMSQSTMTTQWSQAKSEVLAQNTDDEDD